MHGDRKRVTRSASALCRRVPTRSRPHCRQSNPNTGTFFFFQAEDGIRDHCVTGVQTCALPICLARSHDIVITGRHRADLARLRRDLKRLCEEHIRFFGEPAPMKRFVFLVTAVGEGYGGLEHRASTALLCSRDDLPREGESEVTERYRTFLGLAS